MRWVEQEACEKSCTVGKAGGGRIGGYLLIAAGVLLIFLCMPFRLWMILLGAALIVIGYLLAFGR